jgi:hypothetical protein
MLKGLGRLFSIVVTVWALSGLLGIAEELPLTENVPMSEFQNRTEDVKAYDFDAPPQGLFRSITMAEDFEERLGSLRTHEIVPIKPSGCSRHFHRVLAASALSGLHRVRSLPVRTGGGCQTGDDRQRRRHAHRSGG